MIPTSEEEIEEMLITMIKNNSNIEAEEDDIKIFDSIKNIGNFDHLCTSNRGVYINFEDGTQVLLTIQAYIPDGRRMQ